MPCIKNTEAIMALNVFNNVELETERLVLRNFRNEDKQEFYSIIQDPQLYKTLPEDHMYNLEEVNNIVNWFIYRYDQNTLGDIAKFPLVISLKENNQIIGDIGIGNYFKDKTATEVFYFINSTYWNKGYVSEAMEVFMKYIRENKLAKRLIANIVQGNVASEKILIKNGFKYFDHKYDDERIFYELIM
jgi:Acetyltransferases, including N-acetylases of ribosomal proteins